MALIESTSAALRFFGNDLDPDALTTLLCKSPSIGRRKGEVIRSEATSREQTMRTGSSLLRVEERKPGDLDAQINEIFSQLTQNTAVCKDLAKYTPDLFVGLWMSEPNEMIDVSTKSISLPADHGVFKRSVNAASPKKFRRRFLPHHYYCGPFQPPHSPCLRQRVKASS